MRLGVSGAISDGAVVAGDVEVLDGRVFRLGLSPAGSRGIAIPGMVEVQVNGFAGVDFLSASVTEYDVARRALAATGVTAFLPTFVSMPLDAYWSALATVSDVIATAGAAALPRILGVHLEGPFLAPAWRGAHARDHLIAPDPGIAAKLLDTGVVAMMTVAPELPGGLDLVSELTGSGVVVAIGHSDADAATAHEAFDRGARSVTHLYNAHRRWTPRDPGLAGAALTRSGTWVQLIVDGVHLADETVLQTWMAARDRVVLTTDAVAAAGGREGTYELGGDTVELRAGAVRRADGALAGSALTMDQAVRNLVGLGVALPAAVGCATHAPASLLGVADVGHLRPGARADVVVLDDALDVVQTLIGGREAHRA